MLIFAIQLETNKKIRIMANIPYAMLIGEPVRCYHYNTTTQQYEYNRLAYYIGNGYSVDRFTKPFRPIKYDRYIPHRLYDCNECKLLTHDWELEDFNTDKLVDFEYQGQFDEYDWWNDLKKALNLKIKQARICVDK